MLGFFISYLFKVKERVEGYFLYPLTLLVREER